MVVGFLGKLFYFWSFYYFLRKSIIMKHKLLIIEGYFMYVCEQNMWYVINIVFRF